MKVWSQGKYVDIHFGDKVCILRLGGFLHNHWFGEGGTFERVTKQKRHLIFVSDSGGVVKTKYGTLGSTVGKMGKEGWCVYLGSIDDRSNVIHDTVKYWDDKTCTFKKK